VSALDGLRFIKREHHPGFNVELGTQIGHFEDEESFPLSQLRWH